MLRKRTRPCKSTPIPVFADLVVENIMFQLLRSNMNVALLAPVCRQWRRVLDSTWSSLALERCRLTGTPFALVENECPQKQYILSVETCKSLLYCTRNCFPLTFSVIQAAHVIGENSQMPCEGVFEYVCDFDYNGTDTEYCVEAAIYDDEEITRYHSEARIRLFLSFSLSLNIHNLSLHEFERCFNNCSCLYPIQFYMDKAICLIFDEYTADHILKGRAWFTAPEEHTGLTDIEFKICVDSFYFTTVLSDVAVNRGEGNGDAQRSSEHFIAKRDKALEKTVFVENEKNPDK